VYETLFAVVAQYIKKIYPFEQNVAAHHHMEIRRTKGKILVAIAPNGMGL
jgi:NADPH:quinone reductase-like Zn-dependent oxidoreductase